MASTVSGVSGVSLDLLSFDFEESSRDPAAFDIDVDVAPFFELRDVEFYNTELLIDARWYRLLRHRRHRPQSLQRRIEQAFDSVFFAKQWEAARQRKERRRALRAPLLSRVQLERGSSLVAFDISPLGLGCSGIPTNDDLDIEFKLPGLAFPVAARAEVTHFKQANVRPLTGLRFTDIEPFYLEQIQRYVGERREKRAA